jgi:hypothetical protein
MFNPLFDSLFYPSTTHVIVVSEERLKAVEREQKKREVEDLRERIEAFEKKAEMEVSQAKTRLVELEKEVMALEPAKEDKADG